MKSKIYLSLVSFLDIINTFRFIKSFNDYSSIIILKKVHYSTDRLKELILKAHKKISDICTIIINRNCFHLTSGISDKYVGKKGI